MNQVISPAQSAGAVQAWHSSGSLPAGGLKYYKAREPGRTQPDSSAKSKAPREQTREHKDLQDLLRRLNITSDLFEIQAEFDYVDADRRVQITVKNTVTGKVIRSIPPSEFHAGIVSLRTGIGYAVNRTV